MITRDQISARFPFVTRLPVWDRPPTVAVVRLQGVIAASGRGTLNDRALAATLERAFRKGKPKAVALEINSPGGSPTQSSMIGARIRRLAEKHDIPVYAFVEDVAASGGYWLASCADEIYVDASSVVGSIGVISAGFGLDQLIAKHGIERRVHTAGQSKSQLDPFRAENPEDVARLKSLLEQIHETFIDHVKARRGDRLVDDPKLFTGEIWVGARAVDMGLVDGVAHLKPKMIELFGEKLRLRRYDAKRPMLSRLGVQIAGDAIATIEERAEFARFGL